MAGNPHRRPSVEAWVDVARCKIRSAWVPLKWNRRGEPLGMGKWSMNWWCYLEMVEDFYGENRKTIYKLVLLLGTYEKVIYKLHVFWFLMVKSSMFLFLYRNVNFWIGEFPLPVYQRWNVNFCTPSGFVEQTKRPSDGSQGNIERLGKLFWLILILIQQLGSFIYPLVMTVT